MHFFVLPKLQFITRSKILLIRPLSPGDNPIAIIIIIIIIIIICQE
jgi:hypothetical protein